jgi:hypothetical protein
MAISETTKIINEAAQKVFNRPGTPDIGPHSCWMFNDPLVGGRRSYKVWGFSGEEKQQEYLKLAVEMLTKAGFKPKVVPPVGNFRFSYRIHV